MTRPRALTSSRTSPSPSVAALLCGSRPLIWGRRPLPLLPGGLRRLWSRETLPDWAATELGLLAGSTFAALGAEIWANVRAERISSRLRQFLTARLRFRVTELRNVPLLTTGWPRQFDPRGFPWRPRIRAALSNSDLMAQPARL